MAGRRTGLAQEISQASRGVLTLEKVGTGWPALGHIRIGSGTAPTRLYVGPIGESHRDRDDERRFQNPGADKPIELLEGGVCLLFGVEMIGDQQVVVAMDAYRRADLRTRFSMFMPASLLKEAADTGYAMHETQTGETLHAFKASRLSDYLAKLIDVRSAGLRWSEDDVGAAPESSRDQVATVAADGAIHIRPKVGMYAAFARLNYKPWFAIAEFVDNSVQSYLSHRAKLPKKPLEVDIRFDESEIVITDRAAGIALHEFPRAFSPSQPPPDASGLSEFGLGMKAAACWFARHWTVRTSAVGDPFERSVRFDIDKITRDGIEHLPIESRAGAAADHFTVLTLRSLRVRPQRRTLTKIKEHLASIYRVLIEKEVLKLRITTSSGSEELAFERAPLLKAPYFREPDGKPREWRKEISIELPDKRRVWGWAGLLERGSGSHAGFSVFRRDRLIQGSADETYRPLRIFRNPNSYTYQRLAGELFVEGFEVSHTKDGIQWGGYEDDVLSKIHDLLTSKQMPMLAQAEGFRVRQRAHDLPASFGAEAVEGAGAEIQSASDLISFPTDEVESQPESAPSPPPPPERVHQSYETTINDAGERVTVRLELIQDSTRAWYGYTATMENNRPQLEVWINLAHPFSESYVNSDENTLGPLVRLVTALVFAEQGAIQVGFKRAAGLRVKVNDLLRRFGEEEERGRREQ